MKMPIREVKKKYIYILYLIVAVSIPKIKGRTMEPINTDKIQASAETESILNSIRKDISRKAGNKKDASNKVIDDKQLDDISNSINEYLKSVKTDLNVEIHRKTHTAIFKIVRSDDKKLIIEVPPSELLEIAVRIKDMAGSFFDSEA